MAWIEVHQSLQKHRKTLRAVGLLGVDRHKFIGHLVVLWCWALDNTPSDGDLGNLSDEEIAAAADWPTKGARQFLAALTEAGFIDQGDGGRSLHNWHKYAGHLLDKRAANRERMRLARAEFVQRTSRARAGATVPNPTVPNPTVPNPTVPLAHMEMEWLRILRAVSGWDSRGEERVEALVDWAKKKGWTREQLEASAIGLSSTQEKTLKGYPNLAAAFQRRLNSGWDDPVSVNGRVPDATPQRRLDAGSAATGLDSEGRPLGADGLPQWGPGAFARFDH